MTDQESKERYGHLLRLLKYAVHELPAGVLYDSFQTTYAAYRALPEEADAWDAGTRAAAAVKSAFGPRGP